MAKVEQFEDLRCWQMSRTLVKLVYQSSLSGELSKDFSSKDQLRRASLSVMNNIAEGFARYSKQEFILFLNYAQSSAAEVKSMLYVCEDLNYIPTEKLKELHQLNDQLRKAILALIKYLASSQKSYTGVSGSRVREPREIYRTYSDSYQISDEHL
ncbi:four helix bundle protein [Catalinimonas niigatensis]|uniref:four helix bundle protein n=1 Tax=Catalinimonas niigatensis TaxID=1397264 RepID=UPI00266623FD|nr:four helix bundle protein [Catalinimonas niigatensis]WPP52734.1 four helix bundle protein [Catalinimonas niigatensis]